MKVRIMEKANFNKYIITDLLHEKNGYDGVVCTDWLVTANEVVNQEYSREKHGESRNMEKIL